MESGLEVQPGQQVLALELVFPQRQECLGLARDRQQLQAMRMDEKSIELHYKSIR